MTVDEIVATLRSMRNERNREGQARFGIDTARALGVSVTELRTIARAAGRDHRLAQQLWATNIHEARILATMVDEPAKVTAAQMERWSRDVTSWDLCDQMCGNLFDKTPFAVEKARAWSKRDLEFVKRAGFAMMASLAVHDKRAPDSTFITFLDDIERESDDDRNFVRKAVNWALRQIGKRNAALRAEAIARAEKIKARGTRAARWIANDALRELRA